MLCRCGETAIITVSKTVVPGSNPGTFAKKIIVDAHFLVYIKCISIYTGKIRNAKTFLLFDIVGVLRYTLEVPVVTKHLGEDGNVKSEITAGSVATPQ